MKIAVTGKGGIIDLIDIAVVDGEIFAAAINLHRVTEASGGTDWVFKLNRATYPAYLAVCDRQALVCTATDGVSTAILHTDIINMHLVSSSKDIAIGEQLDRLETLGGASLGGAEIDAFLVAIVVVHIKVTLQVAVALELLARIDVERGQTVA